MSYTFKTVDITALNAKGVRLYKGSTQIVSGTVVNTGDIIRAENRTRGKCFYMWQFGASLQVSSVDFYATATGQTDEFLSFTLSNRNRDGLCTFKEPREQNPSSPYTVWAGFSVDTQDMPAITDYIVTAADIAGMATNKVTLTAGGVPVTEGMVIPYGTTLIATAGDGVAFRNNSFGTPRVSAWISGIGISGSTVYTDDFTLSNNNKTATYVLKSDPSVFEWTKLNLITYVNGYTVTKSDVDGMVLHKVTMTDDGVNVVEGTFIEYGSKLVAHAGSGVEFRKLSTVPTSSIYFDGQDNAGSPSRLSFNISDDNKTANVDFVPPYNTVTYFALISDTYQSTNVKGSNNVYSIDQDILTELNKERFVVKNEQLYDYGQYIISLLEFPFYIDPTLILAPESIILANIKTTVTAPVVSTDNVVLNLGSISVPKTNNNLLDYVNTVAILHLPRTDSVIIELEYVIGETLNINYGIDFYTGNATINVTSSKINDVIFTRIVNMGVSIPYVNTATGTSIDNSNISVGGDNGVKIPFIELVKNDMILPDGFFTIPIVDENKLTNQTGFIRVDEIDLVTSALGSEKSTILSMLNSGVIIK